MDGDGRVSRRSFLLAAPANRHLHAYPPPGQVFFALRFGLKNWSRSRVSLEQNWCGLDWLAAAAETTHDSMAKLVRAMRCCALRHCARAMGASCKPCSHPAPGKDAWPAKSGRHDKLPDLYHEDFAS
jgi:hypothetical protein